MSYTCPYHEAGECTYQKDPVSGGKPPVFEELWQLMHHMDDWHTLSLDMCMDNADHVTRLNCDWCSEDICNDEREFVRHMLDKHPRELELWIAGHRERSEKKLDWRDVDVD